MKASREPPGRGSPRGGRTGGRPGLEGAGRGGGGGGEAFKTASGALIGRGARAFRAEGAERTLSPTHPSTPPGTPQLQPRTPPPTAAPASSDAHGTPALCLRSGFRSLLGGGGREAARPGSSGLLAGVRGHQGQRPGPREAHGPPRPALPHAPHPTPSGRPAPRPTQVLHAQAGSGPLMGSGPAHLPYTAAGWTAPGRGSQCLAATPVHQPDSLRLVGPQAPWERLGAGNRERGTQASGFPGTEQRGCPGTCCGSLVGFLPAGPACLAGWRLGWAQGAGPAGVWE